MGLCSHKVLTLQVTWWHDGRRIEAGTLDRVDRSPRDQQLTHVLIICISDVADSKSIRKLRLRQVQPLPRRLNSAPTTASIALDFGLISPLKTHVVLLCSSTFDRFVKELSEFRGRSLVYRDPPAFRLNSEGIGAGLITNSSMISSNFPMNSKNP